MTARLTGKIALLSGAGGAKGLALARLFADEGAKVVISDIDEASARRNVEDLPGRAVEFLRLDVTQEADWVSAVDHCRSTYGGLDILVNSARTHTQMQDICDLTLESWRAQTAVNLDGAFVGVRCCLPLMRESGGGSIVNVVSLSGLTPFAPSPAYSASHAALLNFTKAVAVHGGRGQALVRSNAVICGVSANSPVEAVDELARKTIPLGRPANPGDIARAILWLASDDSSYVTGSSIVLDGGHSAELRYG